MFGLGPIYIFLIDYRFNRKRAGMKERFNTYITNISIAGLAGLLCWTIGWQQFLLVQGPIFLVSGIAGIWLFYVQHQFEEAYYETDENWDYVKAALQGSSFYKLPRVLHWITGNIGFHHIHHLSPRVPNYYLERLIIQTTDYKMYRRSLYEPACGPFVSESGTRTARNTLGSGISKACRPKQKSIVRKLTDGLAIPSS